MAPRYIPPGGTRSTRSMWILELSLTALASGADAQPLQIAIAPPAEATTMDPGRGTQVRTVNYFVNLYDTRFGTG